MVVNTGSDIDPGEEPSMECQCRSSWKGGTLGLHTMGISHASLVEGGKEAEGISHIARGRGNKPKDFSPEHIRSSNGMPFPQLKVTVTIPATSPF